MRGFLDGRRDEGAMRPGFSTSFLEIRDFRHCSLGEHSLELEEGVLRKVASDASFLEPRM